MRSENYKRQWFTYFNSLRCLMLVLNVCFPAFTYAENPRPASSDYVWKSVAIHGGGFVSGIVADPNVAGLLYARTDVGGAYRWNASKQTWIGLTDWVTQTSGNLLGCESIAIDPSDSDRIYLALGLYTNSWGGNGAIVRSSDRGKSFMRTDVPFKMGGNCPGRSCGERLVVDPNDGRVLFFGSRAAGLWKSTDQAKTWAKVDSFPAVATSISAADNGDKEWPIGISFVHFYAPSGKSGSPTPVIFAGICTQQTSFFRSNDSGNTWAAVRGQPVGMRLNHLAVASDGIFYISYGDQAGPNSATNGAVWAFNPQSDQWNDVTPEKPTASDQFGYGAVTADSHHSGTLMACSIDRWHYGDTVFRSVDAGRHWTNQIVGGHGFGAAQFSAQNSPWAMSLAAHWLGDIQIDPYDSQHVLLVTGYGIWASHDASALNDGNKLSWVFEDRGLEETVPLELVSLPAGPHLISAIGDFDGFAHDDLDVSPARGRHSPNIGSTSGLDFAGKVPNRVVRAGGNGRAFYSDDAGHFWTELESKPAGCKTGGEIAIASDGKTILWQCGAQSTYRTNDLGKTWTPCRGLPHGIKPVSDKVDPNLFYCLDSTSGKLFVSSDAGESFVSRAMNLTGKTGDLRGA